MTDFKYPVLPRNLTVKQPQLIELPPIPLTPQSEHKKPQHIDIYAKLITEVKNNSQKQIINKIAQQTYWLSCVKKCGNDIIKVPKEILSEDICIEAIKQDINSIQHIPHFKISDAIYKTLIDHNKPNFDIIVRYAPIKNVKENLRTLSYCIAIIRSNINDIGHVPKKYKTYEFYHNIITEFKSCPKILIKDFMTNLNDKYREKLLEIISDNKISIDIYDLREYVISGKIFNKLMSGKTLIRLFNKTKIHNGWQYLEKLNIDPIKFNPQECSAGGFYFIELQYWQLWKSYNNDVMEYYSLISIPDNSKIFIEFEKFKSDKLFIHSFLPLQFLADKKVE